MVVIMQSSISFVVLEIWISLDMMLWKMKVFEMLDFGDKIDPVLFSILISVLIVEMLGSML